MTGDPRVRLATKDDMEPIVRLAGEVFADLAARMGRPEHFPSPPSEPVRPDRLHRYAHLLATDPALQWVAEDGGTLVGAACGLEREGLWACRCSSCTRARRARGSAARCWSGPAAAPHAG